MQIRSDMANYYGLSESDVELTMSNYIPTSLKANEFFLEEEKICDKIGFVKSGMFRSYFYDDFANQITTNFYPPGSLIISFDSFNNQVPSKENIIACVDSELLVIGYEDQKAIYEKIPVWQQICRDLADQISKDMMERSVQFQTLSATERYKKFCKESPEVLQTVALTHIASFLGIDNATLSRIRKKI